MLGALPPHVISVFMTCFLAATASTLPHLQWGMNLMKPRLSSQRHSPRNSIGRYSRVGEMLCQLYVNHMKAFSAAA